MLKIFSRSAVVWVSLFSAWSVAQPVISNPGGGYYSIELVEGALDEYDIFLADTLDNAPANFAIGTQVGGASGFKINNIYVAVVENPTQYNIDQRVRISIRDIDDPLEYADVACLGNIYDHPDVETEITAIRVTGDLGWNSVSENGLIIADELHWISSFGNWYSTVVTDHYDDSPGQPLHGADTFNAVRGGYIVIMVAKDLSSPLETKGL